MNVFDFVVLAWQVIVLGLVGPALVIAAVLTLAGVIAAATRKRNP